MEDYLKIIIKDYLEEVNLLCYKLIEGLKLKSKLDLWDYRKINNDMQIEVNGIKYIFHGRGCQAYDGNNFVDWDFGYGSRWCGIEPWLLAITLKENKSSYIEYYDGKRIIEECERAVLNGEMYKKYNLYYFSIPISDTFEPDFPSEFDTLVIENYDLRWEIPRDKMVDRFLRKSKRIYKNIEKNLGMYTLKFLLNGKEVYSILYDDIEYPENAVKIMEELIKNN